MDVNFSKENVEYFWKLLNTSQKVEEKKAADEYLRNFKLAPQALDICIQLFDSPDQNSKFLAAMILYQTVKERIGDIMNTKQEFLRYRDLILNNLLEKMKTSPAFIIERICFTLAILVATGVATFWPESIEDILGYAKTSRENCYLALIILESINKELFELNIMSRNLMKTKDTLIDKNQLIQDFIFLVISSIQASPSAQDAQINNQLFNMTLKLTHSWIKLGLNVLKIPLLAKTLINSLNVENIKNVAEIFSDSIQFSNSSRYYSTNDVYEIDEIVQKYDKLEIQSIELLIEMIKNTLMKISTNLNNDEFIILDGIANIFSAILENFVNLMFLKNELSQTLNEIFFFFISHKNKKISYKFFETVNELREFINRGYKFNNFNNDEKLEYSNFLIKICESVMTNCKLKDLNINLNALNKKENLTIEDIELIQGGDSTENTDDDDYGVSLVDYRKSSEDIFYNIFLILTSNFNESGAEFFFNWVNNILAGVNIFDEKLSTDVNRLLVIEIVIMVVKSILDSIEINDMNNKFIVDFTSAILKSSMLNNEFMIIKFLYFLDQACSVLGKDQTLLSTLVTFLLNISKNKVLECTSSYVLLEITDFIKTPSIDSFRVVYEFYSQNYDNLTLQTVNQLCDSLCNLIGVLDRDQKLLIDISEDEAISYFNFILTPANERIIKTFQILSKFIIDGNMNLPDNDLYNKIKLEFLKSYTVHNGVLKKSAFLTKKVLKGTFHIHMKEIGDVTQQIFALFNKDTHFIRELCKIYAKCFANLGEDSLEYFDKVNSMMLNAYVNNNENYPVLGVIKVLYSEVSAHSLDKKAYIGENFMNLCDLINKNVILMKKNQVELLDIYAQLIIKTLETVDYLIINQEILFNVIDLFLDVLRSIAEPSLNKNIIKSLTRIISESKIIPKEVTLAKFPQMVYGVFVCCDHYESSSFPDFTQFTLNALKYDENIFVNTLYSVFGDVKFKNFKKEHVDLIVKYLTTIGRNEKQAKLILSDIVNNAKGMGQMEAFLQYGVQMAHWEKKQKTEG